jgi:hypothetical protein
LEQQPEESMRILLNWYYYRPDLTRHLLDLGQGHDLFFIDRHFHDGLHVEGAEVLYWGDYPTPYALLEAVRPDKVVFSDIESFPQLALNIAARNLGIPTIVLQHGSQTALLVDRAPDQSEMPALSNTSVHTMRFLAGALQWKNRGFALPLAKFVLDRKRYPLVTALRRNPCAFRWADHYVEFSSENASYFKARDKVPEDRFIYIGNSAYDELFQRALEFEPQDYALMIDAPFLEAGDFAFGRVSPEDKARYLAKLDQALALKGMPLRVKLHPLSYDAELPSLPNTEYVRDVDVVPLVGQAKLVISVHYSTMSAPLLHLKPFYAFSSGATPETPFLQPLGIVRDLLRFDPADLGEPNEPLSWDIVKDYLYSVDGQSSERLKRVLFGVDD